MITIFSRAGLDDSPAEPEEMDYEDNDEDAKKVGGQLGRTRKERRIPSTFSLKHSSKATAISVPSLWLGIRV